MKAGKQFTRNNRLDAYGIALLSVALALTISLALGSVLRPTPNALFFVAVMVSAWYGGLRPGIVATVLSTVAVNYYFVEPYYSLKIADPGTMIRLIVFVMAALMISGLNESRRTALHQEQKLRIDSEAAQSETQTAKEQLEMVLTSISDGFYTLDRNWCYTYVNDRLCEIVGKQKSELLGYSYWQVFPDAVGTEIDVQFHRAMHEQTVLQFEYFDSPWKRWFEYRVYPSPMGLTIFAVEVTDRKQFETAIHRSETQLRLITDALPVLISYVDHQRCYRFVNRTYTDWFGLLPQDIVGKPVAEILGQDAYQAICPDIDRVLSGKPVSSEKQVFFNTAGWRDVQREFIPDIAANSEVKGYYALVSDITERKQTEQALRDAEGRLRIALQNAPITVFSQDQELRYSWIYNPVLHDLEELLGKHDRDFLPPESAELLTAIKQQVLETGIGTRQEIKITRDKTRYFDLTIEPLFNSNQTISGIICAAFDISELKRNEIDLRENEERLRLAMEGAQMGTWDIDLRTGKAIWSELLFRMLGYEPNPNGEATEAMWSSRIYPDDLERVAQEWQQSRRERRLYQIEYRAIRADNQQVSWLAALGNFTYSQSGEPVHSIGVLFDITERKQAELMLIEQKRLLELIATGRSLNECLLAICASVSNLNPHIRACILVADAQRHAFTLPIAPNFPPSFGQGLENAPINELAIGTCGTALYRGEPVTCADIAHDDRWSQEWRNLCIAHGILACHSSPILGLDGLPLGSLMLCFNEARLPTDWEYQLANFGTQVASLVFERDRTNLALRESEARFRGVVESNMVGILFWDASGCISDGNEMAMQMLGYGREELQSGQVRWIDITPPEFHEVDAAMQTQLLTEGVCPPFEKAYIRKDGTQVPILIGGALLPGYSDRGVAYFLDITDRKQRELNAYFLANITQDLAHSVNIDNLFQTIGDKICDYFGFSLLTFSEINDTADRSQVIYNNRSSGVPDAIGEHQLADYLSSHQIEQLKAGKVVAIEDVSTLELEGDDAADQPFQVCSTLIAPYMKGGQLQFILSGSRNTRSHWRTDEIDLVQELAARIWIRIEHARIEANLQRSEAEFRIISNAAPALVWVGVQDGSVIFFNDRWYEFTGQTEAEAIGFGWTNATHPDDMARIFPYWEHCRQTGEPYEGEVRYRRHDGEYSWYAFRALPRRNGAGDIEAWYGLSIDISDRKQAETEREQLLVREQAAREAAEAANRIKDEFLAVVSHELRSPLNPILGWSKLLRTRQLDEQKTDRALEVIERNAQMQAQLINDLLDVSRILRGKLSLNHQPVDLISTIQAAIETVRLAAESKSIQIQTMLDPQVGYVLGDAGRLQQVIWNLLSNAVKFTAEAGRVKIRLEQMGHEGKNEGMREREDENPSIHLPIHSYAQITVTDTGKGIPADFLPYVFDHFRQESSSTTRRFGGLGLGLAIVRYLVELHGGTVQAESLGEGQGATFTVKLPLLPHQVPSNQSMPSSEPSLDLQGIKILVVDDDDNTRELLAFLLELHGANVLVVTTASEAIATLIQFQPDVLLSDIGMPDMDGYMLLRQVRLLPPEQGGQIPAIALTAYAGEVDYQQAMAAGFQHHIPKPLEPEVLIKTITSLIK